MAPEKLGWIMGLLDGEGSIVLNGKDSKRSPRITIPSTDLPILEELKRQAGGYICFRKDVRSHVRKAWVWMLSSKATLSLLAQGCHLLTCPLKRKRADYLLRRWKFGRLDRETRRELEAGFYALTDERELRDLSGRDVF